MIIKNKILITLVFGVFLLSFVAAETNVSIMYAKNSSGDLSPLEMNDDGRLKISLNLLNVSAGDLAATGNLSLGQKITFALGETIDNIVDGWIRVTGGLNISTGNLSLGGKLLSNDNGVLMWGGEDVKNNVSILYAENSSGGIDNVGVSDNGGLKLSIRGVRSGIWEVVSGAIQLVNAQNVSVDGFFTASSNGVGIGSDISKDSDYTLVSADRNRVVRLNSSAGGHTNFTLPAGAGGEIYRILNDAEYKLTIKPTGTDSIWNSGNGYGIDLPDKGTYVELRYSSSVGKWDILQKTGGKVLIEGLVLMEPMNRMYFRDQDSSTTITSIIDESEQHIGLAYNGISQARDFSAGKFVPGSWIFEGTDEFLQFDDGDDWDIFGTNESGAKTVAFWVLFDALSSDKYLLTQYEDGSNYFNINVNTNTQIYAISRSGGSNVVQANGGTISTGQWQHVALVINGSDIGIYINGTQVGYDGNWSTDTYSASLYVGTFNSTSTNNFLDGRMQDLHISYNNPYNANPNSGSTDSFTLPAAPFRGVMQ